MDEISWFNNIYSDVFSLEFDNLFSTIDFLAHETLPHVFPNLAHESALADCLSSRMMSYTLFGMFGNWHVKLSMSLFVK